jgi:hypothetical protein
MVLVDDVGAHVAVGALDELLDLLEEGSTSFGRGVG